MDALPAPNLMDIAAGALVALAALRGYFRGLSGELAGLIAHAGALAGGVLCFGAAGDWLQRHSRVEGPAAFALAFIVIVVGAIVFMLVLRWIVGRVLRVVVADGVNHLGGVIAGILRGVVLVLIVFAAVNLMPPSDWTRRFGEESVVGTLVQQQLPRVYPAVDGGRDFGREDNER